jgi:hypothetical protein
VSQSHGSSHASDSLCDSGQGSIYSDSGSASDQDINSSDSASSDFSATSATSFNHGLLLSALRAIHLELQRLNLGLRKSHHTLLRLLAKQKKFYLILEALQSDNQGFKAIQSENRHLKSGRATALAPQSAPRHLFA